jgi:hypothetical protein
MRLAPSTDARPACATDEEEARTLLHARNEAHRQPTLNLRTSPTPTPSASPRRRSATRARPWTRAYARKAQVTLPSLENYEKRSEAAKTARATA